jgi:hypothetical protein
MLRSPLLLLRLLYRRQHVHAVLLQPPAQCGGFMAGELGAFQGGALASGDGEIDVYHIAKVVCLGYIVRVDERAANLEELHGVPAFLLLAGAADSHWCASQVNCTTAVAG